MRSRLRALGRAAADAGRWLLPRPARRLAAATVRVCLRYRVTGLAAEGAFFALLSLPPLVLGLTASAAWVGEASGIAATDSLRRAVRDAVSPFLTEEAVESVILPTLVDALQRPRVDLISVGFALSVWSGSRALNVYVDTISIMYGLGGHRGIVRTRLLSLTLYLATLVLAAVTVPMALIGPRLLVRALPDALGWTEQLLWPVSLLGALGLLGTLYHVATPVRARWSRNLPGAVLAVVIWFGASWVLRTTVDEAVGGVSIYGPLTTTILVLVWSYLLAIAVLVGAGLNAATQELWPTPGQPPVRPDEGG